MRPSDRVAVGHHLSRERLVDDHDVEGLLGRRPASAHQRDAHGAQIGRRHHAHRHRRRRGRIAAARRRPPPPAGCRSTRRCPRPRRPASARGAAAAARCRRTSGRDPRSAARTSGMRIVYVPFRAEPRRVRLQLPEALDHQAGGGEEQQRERDLEADQQALGPWASRRGRRRRAAERAQQGRRATFRGPAPSRRAPPSRATRTA